jgi:hypothetical protein
MPALPATYHQSGASSSVATPVAAKATPKAIATHS